MTLNIVTGKEKNIHAIYFILSKFFIVFISNLVYT